MSRPSSTRLLRGSQGVWSGPQPKCPRLDPQQGSGPDAAVRLTSRAGGSGQTTGSLAGRRPCMVLDAGIRWRVSRITRPAEQIGESGPPRSTDVRKGSVNGQGPHTHSGKADKHKQRLLPLSRLDSQTGLRRSSRERMGAPRLAAEGALLRLGGHAGRRQG